MCVSLGNCRILRHVPASDWYLEKAGNSILMVEKRDKLNTEYHFKVKKQDYIYSIGIMILWQVFLSSLLLQVLAVLTVL